MGAGPEGMSGYPSEPIGGTRASSVPAGFDVTYEELKLS
jgi:hypothetical protein